MTLDGAKRNRECTADASVPVEEAKPVTEKFSEAKFLSAAHGVENKVKGAKPVTLDEAEP